MKFIRQLHLALSCLFAPLLIVYGLSGAELTQSIDELLETMPIVQDTNYNMAKIHSSHRLSTDIKSYNSNRPFQILTLVVGIGIAVTALLGILATFFTRGVRMTGLLMLLIGLSVPAAILWFQ